MELLECGSYDHVDSNGSVEKLPVSTKKFHLLSKKVIQDILLKLMPSLKEVLELFPAKTPKSDFTTWLCYVLHCSPESAVPTKSMPDLLTWCQKQWEDNGKRGMLSDTRPCWRQVMSRTLKPSSTQSSRGIGSSVTLGS